MSFQIPNYRRSKNKKHTNVNQKVNQKVNQNINSSEKKKSHVQYMVNDIKCYWSNSSIKEDYNGKTGKEARDMIVEFIDKQSERSSYVSYQTGRGNGVNINYVYAENRETALSQMFYGFIKLANSDIDPILDEMKKDTDHWSKSIQGTNGTYNNYSFLHKIVWLNETISNKVFTEIFIKLTKHGISPFTINSDNEDCYGSLLGNYRLSSQVQNNRMDIILKNIPFNIVETKLRGILNKASGNINNFISILRYCYCVYPKLLYSTVIEFLVSSIDLPRANNKFTYLTKMMDVMFKTFNTSFLKDLKQVYFSDVVKDYKPKISYVTNLKRKSCVAKRDDDWDTIKKLAEKIQNIKIKWEPILSDYYFSNYGRHLYLSEEVSINNLVDALHSHVLLLCEEYDGNNDLVVHNRLSWSLECLVGALGEIYKKGYSRDKTEELLINMLEGKINNFNKIPPSIRIKASIRCCVHAGIAGVRDNKIINLIEKIGSQLKDKSIFFLIQEFIEPDKDIKVDKENIQEVKRFLGLEKKNAKAKGFDIWIDDLSYELSTRLSSIKNPISQGDLANVFMCDLMCAINSNKKEELDHLTKTVTNDLILKVLPVDVLKEAIIEMSKDKDLVKDLMIDYPWMESNLEVVVKLF